MVCLVNALWGRTATRFSSGFSSCPLPSSELFSESPHSGSDANPCCRASSPRRKAFGVSFPLRCVLFSDVRCFSLGSEASMPKGTRRVSSSMGGVGVGEEASSEWDVSYPRTRTYASRIPGRVLTATRVTDGGDCVRIYGPETKSSLSLGEIHFVDEFFLSPYAEKTPASDLGVPLDTLIYFLEEDQGEGEGRELVEEDEEYPFPTMDIPQLRHGVKVQFTSFLASNSVFNSSGDFPTLTHVRESDFLSSLPLPSQSGEEAFVKVVCGAWGSVQSPPPLNTFNLLDVSMPSGASIELSIPSNHDAIIYVIEGVGIFGDGSTNKKNQTYQNEGHAICFPSHHEKSDGEQIQKIDDWNEKQNTKRDASADEFETSVIQVKCHECSSLRFLLLSTSAAPSPNV